MSTLATTTDHLSGTMANSPIVEVFPFVAAHAPEALVLRDLCFYILLKVALLHSSQPSGMGKHVYK